MKYILLRYGKAFVCTDSLKEETKSSGWLTSWQRKRKTTAVCSIWVLIWSYCYEDCCLSWWECRHHCTVLGLWVESFYEILRSHELLEKESGRRALRLCTVGTGTWCGDWNMLFPLLTKFPQSVHGKRVESTPPVLIVMVCDAQYFREIMF